MVGTVRAKKSLGQHFLADLNFCRKIVRYAGLTPSDRVVEIGAGTGQLTAVLLQQARQVIALEFDENLVEHLRKRFQAELAASEPRLEIRQVDVLHWNGQDLPEEDPVKLVGNLPYNISTRILAKTTEFKDRFHSFTFMVQKEVAQRILAQPGSKDYGYLTLLLEYHFHREAGFDAPPGVFVPPPRVWSHVMKILPRTGGQEDPQPLMTLIQQAFQHRRKTLWNNLLRASFPRPHLQRAFRLCGLGPRRRPEEVTLQEFQCLARVLYSAD